MNKKQRGERKTQSFVSETNSILRTVQADNTIYRKRLTVMSDIASNGVGIIANTLTMDPSGSSDWTSLASIYDEFRVVGCKLTLVSRQQNSVTAGSNAIMVVYDNDDSLALSSYAQACEYQNVHMIPAIWNDHFAYKFKFSRPSAGKETALPWTDVAAPSASPGAIKMYASTLSVSINYFIYMLEWAVEFRGIR